MSASALLEWEGIAADVSESTDNDVPPVSAFDLAGCCELELEPWTHPGAKLDMLAGVIKFNPNARAEQQHRDIAHEVAHLALRRGGVPDPEDAARYVGGCLLMPRRAMDNDIRSFAWSVVKMRARHVYVSELALAVRITQLRDAVITCIDPRGRKRPWRRPSPWITDPRATSPTPSRFERELANEAWRTAGEIRADSLCYAVPIVDVDGAGEDRVLVVCELEQLALRFRV